MHAVHRVDEIVVTHFCNGVIVRTFPDIPKVTTGKMMALRKLQKV